MDTYQYIYIYKIHRLTAMNLYTVLRFIVFKSIYLGPVIGIIVGFAPCWNL